ncbi:afadin- and alpha-actinin-binding protein-like isoform X2 [Leptopilina boulardi]|uniref:afadin- and alpha-actinin-binding protein-like isoform X2 n=1 Tax=Leptopilina boulardi TaxID=63433 RepID=UPI0021F556CE|nr:afadin- and alpha-actinin-binding protein-like isoform X2 [Leptopilina boulardi]
MAGNSTIDNHFRNLRNIFAAQRIFVNDENAFCTLDTISESLATLSEELDVLVSSPVSVNYEEFNSLESLTSILVQLINASWNLVQRHRMIERVHEKQNDVYHKLSVDNNNLGNQIKRLKENLEKKEHSMSEVQERERRLKVKCENLTRDLKRERDEVLKLKKQLQSKDSQHTHELRRIQQTGHKLKEQLQKSIGTYLPRDKALQNLQAEHEKQVSIHQETISHLEKNNLLMLQEIAYLKDALDLQTHQILQAKSCKVYQEEDVEEKYRDKSSEKRLHFKQKL